MRHRRWVKFLKDYDFTLKYHLVKANIVANALSRKSLHITSMMRKKYELIEQMRDLSLYVDVRPRSLKMSEVRIYRVLEDRIKKFQDFNKFVKETKDHISQGKACDFVISEKGLLKFWERIYVPSESRIREEILEEAHKTCNLHPGAIKLYQYLKKDF